MEQGIEIKNRPNKGDVLIYDQDGYKNTSLNYLLDPLYKKIKTLEEKLVEQEKTIKELKKDIKYLKGE